MSTLQSQLNSLEVSIINRLSQAQTETQIDYWAEYLAATKCYLQAFNHLRVIQSETCKDVETKTSK
ncbi:MAG: hypothetical protein KME21_30715 [Desmonostoc vinosum HA7617-LM4]|jgi:flagellar biosynthesis chaperone FliJ|nr:hypothetical protein [Desmonostoc vinosum HA7617-LM4]